MILQITNTAIFIHPSLSIKAENTNLPMEHLHFRNRPGKEIYFEGDGYLQNNILMFIPKNLSAEKTNFENKIYPP